jgi:hypothetical protein
MWFVFTDLQRTSPTTLWGVVEEAGVKGKRAFTGLTELWGIISSSRAVRDDRKTARIKFSIGK